MAGIDIKITSYSKCGSTLKRILGQLILKKIKEKISLTDTRLNVDDLNISIQDGKFTASISVNGEIGDRDVDMLINKYVK